MGDSVQAQHVLHVEQAVGFGGEKAHGAQAALGVSGAAARLVGDFDALARAREQHGMVAHDVAAAHGGEADGGRVAFAGDAFAAIDGALLEVAPERTRDDLAHFQRGARRRVHLVAMMGFDDLDVITLRQRARRLLQQLEHHVHADAHIGRHDNGAALRCDADARELRLVEARGADDHGHPRRLARGQMRHGAFRPGEVDEIADVLQRGVKIGADGHASVHPSKRPGVLPERRAARHVERGADAAIRRGQDGLDERAAHAAASAGNGDAMRFCRRCAHARKPLRRGQGLPAEEEAAAGGAAFCNSAISAGGA